MKYMKVLNKERAAKANKYVSDALGANVISIVPIQLTETMAAKNCRGWFMIKIKDISPLMNPITSVLVSLWKDRVALGSSESRLFRDDKFQTLSKVLCQYYGLILNDHHAAEKIAEDKKEPAKAVAQPEALVDDTKKEPAKAVAQPEPKAATKKRTSSKKKQTEEQLVGDIV